MARIDRVRKETLPKPKKLKKYREQAEGDGVVEIDENELAIEPEGQSGFFLLEHGPTTHEVGAVGYNSFRPEEYRLLWLIDGRTVETVQIKRTESYIIYADGMEIGSIDESETERFLFLFRLASAWVVRIGGSEIFRMRNTKRPSYRIHLDLPNTDSIETWIGKTKAPSMDDIVFRILHWARLRKAAPANTMWFLPRDKQNEPLADTLEERIALMAFALLLRYAYYTISD